MTQDSRVVLGWRGAICAGIEHEERGWPVDEGEVSYFVRTGKRFLRDGRIGGNMVVQEWIRGSWIRRRLVTLRPVIRDFMVVKSMDPGEVDSRAVD